MIKQGWAGTGRRWAVCLASGWLLTLALLLLADGGTFTDKAFGQGRVLWVAVGTAVFGGLFGIFSCRVLQGERLALAGSSVLLALVSYAYFPDWYFLVGLLAALGLVVLYLFSTRKTPDLSDPAGTEEIARRPGGRGLVVWFWGLGAFFLLFVGGLTTLRYLNYFTPNFDFGLFCNMFYNMGERLVPLVTSERDRLLSHFAVHISPIYYLLLPLYMLFPSPITLQIGQALVLASGLVPLYLLARRLGLSRWATGLLAALYVFFPALAGGTFYDLHENKFLTPLILWLCLSFERKKWPLVYLFALLVCFVKEDAPVYVMFFALYLMAARREYRHGPVLFLLALAYFFGALYLLDAHGEGVMTYRYQNVVYGDGGLAGVFKTALVNPLLLIKESFEPAKLTFALLMFAPLGFLPLFSRRLSSFILVAPMMLVNLIPDYQYQHSIFFQYTYGVTGFLFYLSAQNLAWLERRPKRPRRAAILARRTSYVALAVVAVCIFCANLGDKTSYIAAFRNTKDQRAAITRELEKIPREASVQASTFFVARIARRDVIYEYPSKNETEYIALDLRYMPADKAQEEIEKWTKKGYAQAGYEPGAITVLKQKE